MSLILPATTWTQTALVAIFNATVQSAFDKAFDACFSSNLTVNRNDANISRDEYKKVLESLKFPQQSAVIKFAGLVGSRGNPTEGLRETGAVGGFLEAQIKQGEPGGRPWGLNILTSSLIASVGNDPAMVSHSAETNYDARRIFKLTLVDSVREIPF